MRDRPVFLALHHPPLDLGTPAMDATGLAGRDRLGELARAHGRARRVFFGHVHRPLHGSWDATPFGVLRGLSHQVALSSAPTAGVPGSHEPRAYAVVLIDAGSVVVHHHDFLDAGPRSDLFDPRAERAASPDELVRPGGTARPA